MRQKGSASITRMLSCSSGQDVSTTATTAAAAAAVGRGAQDGTAAVANKKSQRQVKLGFNRREATNYLTDNSLSAYRYL